MGAAKIESPGKSLSQWHRRWGSITASLLLVLVTAVPSSANTVFFDQVTGCRDGITVHSLTRSGPVYKSNNRIYTTPSRTTHVIKEFWAVDYTNYVWRSTQTVSYRLSAYGYLYSGGVRPGQC